MADNRSGGVGLPGLLTVLFVGLKLAGVITWPWVWVLAPLWISVGLGILFFLPVAAIVILGHRYTSRRIRR